MPPFRRLLIAASFAALSACASKPAPAPVPKTVSPQPAMAIDGVYRGTSTRFRADMRQCPHPGLVTLVVQDRQFQFRWNRDIYVDSTITPDGLVSGVAEGITLAGRRTGNQIEGDVTNGVCSLHFTVRKQEL